MRNLITIAEVFNTAALQGTMQWIVKSGLEWKARGTINNIFFSIDLEKHNSLREDHDIWKFKFAARTSNGEEDFGNTGMFGQSSVQVFSSVVNGLREFLAEQQPDAIWFLGNEELGKAKLYGMILKKCAVELASAGYKVKTSSENGNTLYALVKVGSAYDYDQQSSVQ